MDALTAAATDGHRSPFLLPASGGSAGCERQDATLCNSAPWSEYGITAASYIMPNEPVRVADWASETGQGERALAHFARNGNAFIHRANGLSVEDLAVGATQRLLDESGTDPKDIDILLVTGTMATSVAPPPDSLAARLRHRFGLTRAIAFSIAQMNCTSLVGAIQVATRWARQRPAIVRILVVTSDVIHGEAFRNRHGSNIQSDAGAALLVERGCVRNRFGAIELACLPGYHMGFDRVPERLTQIRAERPRILADMVRRAAATSGHPLESFRVLLPANTNKATWLPLAQVFGRDMNFVYTRNIALKGHACCADLAINLVDGGFLDIAPGDSAIAVTIGSTAAFGAITLHGPTEGTTQRRAEANQKEGEIHV